MRGYYIFFGSNSMGVIKKIDMQMAEMRKFFDVELLTVNTPKRTFFKKVAARLPWCPIGFDYAELECKIKKPDFIYVRRFVADCEYVDFFRRIKEKYPECKIIVEIYTYPYDKDEYNRSFRHRIKQLPFYIKDKHYRYKLKDYIDRFVTYSKDEEIFGVRTIQTTNGVSVSSILPKKAEPADCSVISLISVARMQTHHGYERLIKGMGEYYKNSGKRNVVYNVVGDGEETENYRKLVKKYGLCDRVIFHGKKSGAELDNLYNKADIAIASLGLYKYDIDVISTLKTCEYMAKGLPVVTGCRISLIGNETPPYIREYPNNNTPLDIEGLVSFYDSIYSKENRADIIKTIREYALENMDMCVVMKPIIDYILKPSEFEHLIGENDEHRKKQH